MARRRYQDPRPFRRGAWWCLLYWEDDFSQAKPRRKRVWAKLAPASTPQREVQKIAGELLRPINQGLQSIGSATNFKVYVDTIYIPTELPTLASTTQVTYAGILRKHVVPTFGSMALRDMTRLTLQRYFSDLGTSKLSGEVILKIKEVLSSVLGSAVPEFLAANPMLAVKIARNKIVNRNRQKPFISPEEFTRLVEMVTEPYSTMIHTAVFSGLRISELAGLRWEDVHDDALTIDERYCRGDWSVTKTRGSAATIGVDASVIARIQRLKTLEVVLNWGGKGASKRMKVVRSAAPQDLVFQSLRKGAPMRDGNVLRRHLRPAALKLGIDPKKATWRALRRSYGTWLVEAGADPKSVQGQMRHSRISTTMDVYAQYVPESQRRAVAKMAAMVGERSARLGMIN